MVEPMSSHLRGCGASGKFGSTRVYRIGLRPRPGDRGRERDVADTEITHADTEITQATNVSRDVKEK